MEFVFTTLVANDIMVHQDRLVISKPRLYKEFSFATIVRRLGKLDQTLCTKPFFGPLIRRKSAVEVLYFLLLDSHQQCRFRSRQWVENRGGKLGWLVKHEELKKKRRK